MKQRGRVSGSALEIQTAPIDRVDRQLAPHDLTDEEVELWVAIVNSQPAEKFSPADIPVLAQYCRHAIHARRVAELIEKACSDKELKIQDYERLLRMQSLVTNDLCRSGTKLRITQQSTTNHRGNKKAGAARKPWEG